MRITCLYGCGLEGQTVLDVIGESISRLRKSEPK